MIKKKQKTSVFKTVFFLLAILCGLLLGGPNFQEHQQSFSEDFSSTTYLDEKSSVSNWGNGSINLNKKTELMLWNQNPDDIIFPGWIDTVTYNDFNGDGMVDAVATGSEYCNALALVEAVDINDIQITFEVTRWIDGSTGNNNEALTGVGGASIDEDGNCGLTSGDYDLDGDYDFLFVCSNPDSPYTIKRIWLYQNQRVETGITSFTQTNLTSSWSSLLKGIGWSSTMMCSVDFDLDSDIDILFGNKDGEIFEISNLDSGDISTDTFLPDDEPLIETYWGGKGISVVAAGDFNGDEYYDILIGSVEKPEILVYWNDGANNFEVFDKYDNGDGFKGAATAGFSEDWDRDGDDDVIIASDGWNYDSDNAGGYGYHFDNSDGKFDISIILQVSGDEGGGKADLDFGIVMDINQDDIIDIILFNRYYDGDDARVRGRLIINEITDYYNIKGTAYSTTVAPELEEKKLITKVRVTNLEMGFLGRQTKELKIILYFSNDGGEIWYQYKEFKDGDLRKVYNEAKELKFKTYGGALVWRADFSAKKDDIKGFENTSYDTPVIYQMNLEYTYIDEMEFSRSSVTYASYNDGNRNKDVVIAASFIYPSLEGHLRAYEVTSMSFTGESEYSLKTVSRQDVNSPSGREIIPENVEILWDASEVLKETSHLNRNIYTSIPDSETGRLERVEFIESNADILKKYIKDSKKKHGSLINFVRGKDREWKLAWIDHSTPVVVGAPFGNPAKKGEGYAEFLETWQNRAQTVLVGGNGGMLNCFNIETGEELWGYIPFNLLHELKKMSKKKKINKVYTRRFNKKGHPFLDAHPVVDDVYIDSDGDGSKEWVTVLIIGQGAGKGKYKTSKSDPNHDKKKGKYFYNAFNITDPDNPQSLWEFTHKEIGQTWSTPVIAKVTMNDEDKWVAFVGSGDKSKKNYFHVIDIETGELLWYFDSKEMDGGRLPGSPNTVDINEDGYADRVYIGDLKGRMWKVDLKEDVWIAEAIYKDIEKYPIITKPAIWVNSAGGETDPRLYFGTGGDEKAKDDQFYAFIALIDDGNPNIEWYLGDKSKLKPGKDAIEIGKTEKGEKFWADPVVIDRVVYFSSFKGDIEDVDPLKDTITAGKLYGRYIDSSSGNLGGTAFIFGEDFLILESKTRAHVTRGGQRKNPEGEYERDVFIQEYNSTLQVISRGGGPKSLRVKSWREVYKIIK